MPLDVQSGELADRLRAFFRLTGRIPAKIDEITVPTAVVQNLDQAPYRSAVAAGSIGLLKAAVAATSSVVGVRVPPSLAPGVFVLTRVVLVNRTAAATSYELGFAAKGDVTGLAAAGFLLNLDNPSPLPGATSLTRIAVEGWTATQAVPAMIGDFIAPVAAGGAFQLDLVGVALRAGFRGDATDSLGYGATNLTQNAAAEAHFYGTWHPESL